MNCLNDFDFLFLKEKIENLLQKSVIIARIILLELQTEIRREFQLESKGINPISRYWITKHWIEHYKIKHLFGDEENAIRYKSELVKKGGEKITGR